MTNAKHSTTFEEAFRLFQRGNLAAAEATCRELLEGNKRDINAWQLLGMIQNQRGWFDKAIPCFEQIRKLRPDDPLPHARLAFAHMYMGQFHRAATAFDDALRLRPDDPLALRGKAELLERRGELEPAIALARGAAAEHPRDAELALLAATLTAKAGDQADAIELAESLLARADLNPQTRRKLYFTIGAAEDRRGNVDAAFAAWAKGNQVAGRPFPAERAVERTDRIIDAFSAARLAALPRADQPSEVPVFLVGMPRSGSTLVEQIIDAHPQASGVGEVTSFNEMLDAIPAKLGPPVAGMRFPAWIDALPADPKVLARLGKPYLSQLRKLARGANRVADKNLLNFMFLGAIGLLYPHARVVHCVRDPIENGLSCFMNDLSPVGFPWSGDLRHIALFHREHERLMRHWQEVLDLRMLTVSYEALVEDQAAVSRTIIEFCGLPWDDACLRFYETGRAVTTLSYDQVRRPVYRTALKRSERYARLLEPLREALEGSP